MLPIHIHAYRDKRTDACMSMDKTFRQAAWAQMGGGREMEGMEMGIGNYPTAGCSSHLKMWTVPFSDETQSNDELTCPMLAPWLICQSVV